MSAGKHLMRTASPRHSSSKEKVSPNCCTSAQFLPAKTTHETKMSSLLAKNISLYKQLQCKIVCCRGKETFHKKKIDFWNLFRSTPVGLSQREGNFLWAKCLPPLWEQQIRCLLLQAATEANTPVPSRLSLLFLASNTLKMAPVIRHGRARRFDKTGWSICFLSTKKPQNSSMVVLAKRI